jgi:hypothetical protein
LIPADRVSELLELAKGFLKMNIATRKMEVALVGPDGAQIPGNTICSGPQCISRSIEYSMWAPIIAR